MKKSHATINFKIMVKKTGRDGFAPVFMYIQFRGRAVMSTGQRCLPSQFVAGRCLDPQVQLAMDTIRSRVERARLLLDLEQVPYDAKSLLAKAFPPEPIQKQIKGSYRCLMEAVLERRQSAPKTRQLHEYAYRVMSAYLKRKDFAVDELDEATVSRWIRSVEGCWKPLSTKSVLSKLNDIWREYIRQGGSREKYPFDRIRISSFKSDKVKQVLNKSQVEALFRYFDSTFSPEVLLDRNSELFALGTYLFGYVSFGLALVDILKLKASAVVEETGGWRIEGVKRSKTSTPVPLYIIKCGFTQKVMPLLLETAFLRDDYLCPGIQNNSCSLLSDTPERISAQVSNVVRIVNRNLKKIWRKVNNIYNVGIPLHYTFYSMRSSSASIYLHEPGANIYNLAHLMGRRVEGISTYIASVMDAEELLAERRKLLSPGT